MIVEGEEEIGSDHLGDFLAKHKDKLRSDVIVLTDTANLESGIPSLTYRLRGLASIEVEVTGLDHPLHSGMWGGPIPDPVQAMAKILASLTDDRGRVAIDGIYDEVAAPTDIERADLARLPFDEPKFRSDAGMDSRMKLGGEALRVRFDVEHSFDACGHDVFVVVEPPSQHAYDDAREVVCGRFDLHEARRRIVERDCQRRQSS